MRRDGCVDYVEFSGGALVASKDFYARAFGWTFSDYGPSYAAADGVGVDVGLQADPGEASPAPLVILWADDLEAAERRVRDAGAEITRPIFSFPGGRRFHFRDPAGNELGVWSEGAPGG